MRSRGWAASQALGQGCGRLRPQFTLLGHMPSPELSYVIYLKFHLTLPRSVFFEGIESYLLVSLLNFLSFSLVRCIRDISLYCLDSSPSQLTQLTHPAAVSQNVFCLCSCLTRPHPAPLYNSDSCDISSVSDSADGVFKPPLPVLTP